MERDATAARARLEGAVANMLEDTAKTAVVEVEGQVAELRAAAAENEKVVDNLERAARVLGAKVRPRLTPKIGAQSSSTFDRGGNERSIILQSSECYGV